MDISIERILDHMNNDHGDVLPLYVRHFCKREDVKEAKLTDVNEEGMTLLVNGNERVQIGFTKKTDFEGIHLEMIKMAKIARKALNVPAPEHYKDKGHQEEEKIKMEISDFIGNFKSVIIGTVSEEGEPNASYAPFFKYHGDSYLYINETEVYFENFKKNGKASLLFIQDEGQAIVPSMRQRVTYNVEIQFLEKNDYYNEILDEFQKNDFSIQMTRNVPVFHLVKVKLISGRYVKGPRQAFDITKDRRVVEVMLGASENS